MKTPTNLSISFHNISGTHSNTHGCKLDNVFKLTSDIEILAETWSKCKECKTSVDKYDLIENIESSKKTGCKKGRNSGGMLIFSNTA